MGYVQEMLPEHLPHRTLEVVFDCDVVSKTVIFHSVTLREGTRVALPVGLEFDVAFASLSQSL